MTSGVPSDAETCQDYSVVLLVDMGQLARLKVFQNEMSILKEIV